MQLHLSWHATRQLTLSIGCLAGALTQTGCRPKFYCDHNPVVGGDDDEAPELEVVQPERDLAAEQPTAPGQAYALPRPVVRPLVVEQEAEVAVATVDSAEEPARLAAPSRRPAAEAAIEVVEIDAAPAADLADPAAPAAPAVATFEPGEPVAAVAPADEPTQGVSRHVVAPRRSKQPSDPAVRSLGHSVAPSGGLMSGSSYNLSLTGGAGLY